MRVLVCLCLLAATAAPAATVGDTYDHVIAEKGPPKSEIDAGAVRVLAYPDSTIKFRDNVVVSIKAAASAPAQPSPTPKPAGQRPTAAAQIAATKKQLNDAIARVTEIINQPVDSVPRTREIWDKCQFYPDGYFHPGAATPDFNHVDVRKTQDVTGYSPYAYVSSNLTPDRAFPGAELEFNPMTKMFYQDRSVPKKRLTEAEMVEINRLYRIIGASITALQMLGAQ